MNKPASLTGILRRAEQPTLEAAEVDTAGFEHIVRRATALVDASISGAVADRIGQLNQRRADAANAVFRAKGHAGQPSVVFTAHDASVVWDVAELLHSVAGAEPTPLDPAFAEKPAASKPINAAVSRAVAGVHTEPPANEDSKPEGE